MPVPLISLLPIALPLSVYPLLPLAASIAWQNFTITAPIGATQHGDNHLLCVPTRARDIVFFFAANYLAHAATVRPYPGESTFDATIAMAIAVLLPTSGIVRGFTAIGRRGFFAGKIWTAYLGGTPLDVAARSGALCMVVRAEGWKPALGTRLSQVAVSLRVEGTFSPPRTFLSKLLSFLRLDILLSERPSPPSNTGPRSFKETLTELEKLLKERPGAYSVAHTPFVEVFGPQTGAMIRAKHLTYTPEWLEPVTTFTSSNKMHIGTRAVRGRPVLPYGYAFAFVPPTAKVAPLEGDRATVPDPERRWAKVLVSLAQALYAVYTLFQARGDQISRYGITAFGMTVLPYAAMSTINLIGAILTPEFGSLYLIQSDTLLEAQDRTGVIFKGIVGTLLPATTALDPSANIHCVDENGFSGTVEAHTGSHDQLQSFKIDLGGYSFTLSSDNHDEVDKKLPAIAIPACGEFKRCRPLLRPNAGLAIIAVIGTNIFIYSAVLALTGLDNILGQDSSGWYLVFWWLCLPVGGLYTVFTKPKSKVVPLLISGLPAILASWYVIRTLRQYGKCTRYD